MKAEDLRKIAKMFKANGKLYNDFKYYFWCPDCCYMLPGNNEGHKPGCKVAEDLKK